MAKTRAQENRAIRQEALREQLATYGHIQHVIDICDELNELSNVLDATEVNRKKIVIDTKLRLMNKYLPDIKNVEIANDGGGELTIKLIDYTLNQDD